MQRIAVNRLSLVCGLLAIFLFTGAHARTDKIELFKDVKTLSKLEPESQCTSAIRIGLRAQGVDTRQPSTASIRFCDQATVDLNQKQVIQSQSHYRFRGVFCRVCRLALSWREM